MTNLAIPYWDDRFTVGTDHHSNQNYEISRDFLKNINSDFENIIRNSNNIIEIGCGTGELSKMISDKYNKNVLGTDLSGAGVNFANQHHANQLVKYQVLDALNHDIDDKYDLVICSNILEHFQNPFIIMDRILNKCKAFMILVPYNQPLFDRYDHEGGAGHVFHFTMDSFAKYSITSSFTFTTPGWQHSTAGEPPLQLAIVIAKK